MQFSPSLAAQLGIASVLGTLIRTTIDANADTASPIEYPQLVGCFIIGLLESQRTWMANECPVLLFVLSAGLCGSITSFSAFAFHLYQALSGGLHAPTIASQVQSMLNLGLQRSLCSFCRAGIKPCSICTWKPPRPVCHVLSVVPGTLQTSISISFIFGMDIMQFISGYYVRIVDNGNSSC